MQMYFSVVRQWSMQMIYVCLHTIIVYADNILNCFVET